MYNITTTKLKKSPMKVIKELNDSDQEVYVVTRHNKPKAVIMNYDHWLRLTKSKKKTKEFTSLYDAVKKDIFHGPKENSSEIIRKMRDEE